MADACSLADEFLVSGRIEDIAAQMHARIQVGAEACVALWRVYDNPTSCTVGGGIVQQICVLSELAKKLITCVLSGTCKGIC
eukprot:358645-Chlamydomonas_euryale.AAC.6